MRLLINILVLVLGLLISSVGVGATELPSEPQAQVLTLQEQKEYYDYTQEIQEAKRQRNLKVAILFVIGAIVILVALKFGGIDF